MPSDQEPYYLRIWQRIVDPWQLHQGDIVRLLGSEVRWSVRASKEQSGRKLRLRPQYEEGSLGRNIFHHDAILFLAEEGLLEKLLLADIREYDVWANENRAYSYRGNDTWIDLVDPSPSAVTSPRSSQLPDDLALVWRHQENDHES